ncbi:geranylgeranyl transferase type-2 subunit beta [Nematocida sp. AWRm77]|nr:geranylgeranyl transferase type-2 subunit beta [Nematocida sp. AWRm77]
MVEEHTETGVKTDMQKHKEFVLRCISDKCRLYHLSEPMRLSTLYWALNSLFLMKETQMVEEIGEKVVRFVALCQNTDGGFGANIGYPSSPLYTLSALQIMYIVEKSRIANMRSGVEKEIENPKEAEIKRAGEFTMKDRIAELFVIGETDQTEKSVLDRIGEGASNGEISYAMCNAYLEQIVQERKLVGYEFGELDMRFVCCYVASKDILAQICAGDGPKLFGVHYKIKELLCEYIGKCTNLDGGVGPEPGCESHAAHTFCAVSSLFILGEVTLLDINKCARFLALRQRKNGGLSGRVDKDPDGCYAFWSYSSLVMLGKENYIDKSALKKYILGNQSPEGGFSDKPFGVPDLFHTMFSLAALGMMKHDKVMDVVPSLALCLTD